VSAECSEVWKIKPFSLKPKASVLRISPGARLLLPLGYLLSVLGWKSFINFSLRCVNSPKREVLEVCRHPGYNQLPMNHYPSRLPYGHLRKTNRISILTATNGCLAAWQVKAHRAKTGGLWSMQASRLQPVTLEPLSFETALRAPQEDKQDFHIDSYQWLSCCLKNRSSKC